jgi:hypothetical protein
MSGAPRSPWRWVMMSSCCPVRWSSCSALGRGRWSTASRWDQGRDRVLRRNRPRLLILSDVERRRGHAGRQRLLRDHCSTVGATRRSQPTPSDMDPGSAMPRDAAATTTAIHPFGTQVARLSGPDGEADRDRPDDWPTDPACAPRGPIAPPPHPGQSRPVRAADETCRCTQPGGRGAGWRSWWQPGRRPSGRRAVSPRLCRARAPVGSVAPGVVAPNGPVARNHGRAGSGGA